MASRQSKSNANPRPGTGLIALDPWLEPYADQLANRYARFEHALQRIVEAEQSLEAFSRGHLHFGLNRGTHEGRSGVWYREWAPQATALNLVGDFNHWDRLSHPLTKDQYGVWSVFVPDHEHGPAIPHGSLIKVHVHSALGPLDRIPAYIRRCVYDPNTHNFTGQYWDPPERFHWQHDPPATPAGLRIYEAHVGMATEEERIGTYREFAEQRSAARRRRRLQRDSAHGRCRSTRTTGPSATRSAASTPPRRGSARRRN
jgi:1,4-alpha-glucan branching enzyme